MKRILTIDPGLSGGLAYYGTAGIILDSMPATDLDVSILIMDRANTQNINRYGIDIRPSIDSLLEEMKTASSLATKDDYVAQLMILQDKYQQQYGDGATSVPENASLSVLLVQSWLIHLSLY